MSTNQDLKALQTRMAGDIGFRARFLRDPLAAAACLGIALNAGQVAAAQDMHQKVAAVAKQAAADDQPSIISLPGIITTPYVIPRMP